MSDEINDVEELDEDTYDEEDMQDSQLDDTDFDLNDEYKEDPIAPQGTYNGMVKNVEYNGRLNAIVWTVVATGNPGLTMLDGSTPIDGVEFQFFNWLPKKGDENIRSKNGKSNKRQTKINMLKQFQDNMEIDMNTPAKVKEAMEEGTWIGLSVVMNVTISTYNNRTRNDIASMQLSEEDFDMPE